MNKTIKTEIVINASKEKVWAVLTDFKQYPTWNPFIVNLSGELAKGSTLATTLQNGDKTFRFKPKVLSVVPYHYFDWLGSLLVRGIFDGHHYFELEALSPTQVKLTHGEHFSGILSSVILKKVANDTRNNFIRMNAALKQIAENGR